MNNTLEIFNSHTTPFISWMHRAASSTVPSEMKPNPRDLSDCEERSILAMSYSTAHSRVDHTQWLLSRPFRTGQTRFLGRAQ
jgi:hypothetical protein